MYFALRRRQAAMPVFRRRCWSLGYPGRESPAGITSWRTRRMARRKRNVSDLPYAAPPLSCVAFFFKVQKTEIYKEEIEYEVKRQFTAVYFLRRFLLDDLVEHR